MKGGPAWPTRPGSSPLTRGKLLRARCPRVEAGLIPAHAGKTSLPSRWRRPARAHPRSRGENSSDATPAKDSVGSSPLTRGKRREALPQRLDHGLIPAHAGKTTTSALCPSSHRAHPRSRGENPRHRLLTATGSGSSPLTRGKQQGWRRHRNRPGLIPAHAGKTVWVRFRSAMVRAHPRSRGENSKPRGPLCCASGSSPLTRGKRLIGALVSYATGLIPAHAGKTNASSWAPSAQTAHPRSRGENSCSWCLSLPIVGSSPLTRGKHFLTCAFIAQIGQILESLELCASSESYSLRDAYATDALQDQVRSIGLVPLSSRGAS